MKLLHCLACGDIVTLSTEEVKSCLCKKSMGGYKEDGLNAFYEGPAMLIGFSNWSFLSARQENFDNLKAGDKKDLGPIFDAFFIPHNAPTVKYIGERDHVEVLQELFDEKKKREATYIQALHEQVTGRK